MMMLLRKQLKSLNLKSLGTSTHCEDLASEAWRRGCPQAVTESPDFGNGRSIPQILAVSFSAVSTPIDADLPDQILAWKARDEIYLRLCVQKIIKGKCGARPTNSTFLSRPRISTVLARLFPPRTCLRNKISRLFVNKSSEVYFKICQIRQVDSGVIIQLQIDFI